MYGFVLPSRVKQRSRSSVLDVKSGDMRREGERGLGCATAICVCCEGIVVTMNGLRDFGSCRKSSPLDIEKTLSKTSMELCEGAVI